MFTPHHLSFYYFRPFLFHLSLLSPFSLSHSPYPPPLCPQTNLSQFPAMSFDVNRSQMDFQWLYDVLQDAFIRIFERDKKFPNKQEAYNYLQRVVLNTAIDYYR